MLVFSSLLAVFFASSSPVMAQDFCASECAVMGYDTGECDYTTNYCSDFPKCESNLCKYNCFDSGDPSCYPGHCYCYDYEYCDCDTKVCTSTGCAEPSCSNWLGCIDCNKHGCDWCEYGTSSVKCVSNCNNNWLIGNCKSGFTSGTCIYSDANCPDDCGDGYKTGSEECDPPEDNSEQCQPSFDVICQTNLRRVGIKDKYRACLFNCVCGPDMTYTFYSDGDDPDGKYCTNCNTGINSHCGDGTQNCDEEGEDCGGAHCEPCPEEECAGYGEDCNGLACCPSYQCCSQCDRCYYSCPNVFCCSSDDDCTALGYDYCDLSVNKCKHDETPSCIDECTDSGDNDCSPFSCSDGDCTKTCERNCGADAACDGKAVGGSCGTDATCDSLCDCVSESEPDLCPLSEQTSCKDAIEGEISCQEDTLTGCLNESDNKYYKVGETAGQDVTVTVTHWGDNCARNDLYIYDDSCDVLENSIGREVTDECFVEEPEDDIIVSIDGDSYQTNEYCNWKIEVSCEEVCAASESSLIGQYNSGCDQWISVSKNCGMKIGGLEHISGCIYSGDSKFYTIDSWKGESIEVKLTNKGAICRNNALILYDYKNDVIASIEDGDYVKTWVGVPKSNPITPDNPRIKAEVRSYSSDKNCLWGLDINEVGNCMGPCTDAGNEPCNPWNCDSGYCTNVCDKECGADCENNAECVEEHGDGWYCSSDCECLEGVEGTITIYKGTNIIGVTGLTDDDFSDCDLDHYVSSTKAGCEYDDNGYFVYYDPFGDNGGDCDSNFFSADTMEQDFAYYLYARDQCEITFRAPLDVEVPLYPGSNLISVPVETTLDDIASECGNRNDIFEYYVSSTRYGCRYDDNGYFVYYDAGGSGDGDCGSMFKSDDRLRPFVGYYLHFNGKNGDGETHCVLKYEKGILIESP
jgi:hypothetical protein